MKCEIIKDLLPIYCDGLASEETREEVEKHLAACDECRNIYESMKAAVPDAPQVDIQPMKKIKRKLFLRTAPIVTALIFAVFFAVYNLLCVDPLPISSKNVSYDCYPTIRDEIVYIYTYAGSYGGETSRSYSFPKDSDPIIDKENDCVWLDGEKVEHGHNNNETLYLPGNGKLCPGGMLNLNIKFDSPFKYTKIERSRSMDRTPNYFDNTAPCDEVIVLKPCLTNRQLEENERSYEEFTVDGMTYHKQEYFVGDTYFVQVEASRCGEGATLTIKCLDKDIVIDLHELAVEEGLLEE